MALPERLDRELIVMAMDRGSRLFVWPALRLDRKIEADPAGTVYERIAFLSYCFRSWMFRRSDRRLRHVSWFIRHFPGSCIHHSPEFWLLEREEDFGQLAGVWEEVLGSSDCDADVYVNASWYFHAFDTKKTIQLLEQAMVLDPEPAPDVLLGAAIAHKSLFEEEGVEAYNRQSTGYLIAAFEAAVSYSEKQMFPELFRSWLDAPDSQSKVIAQYILERMPDTEDFGALRRRAERRLERV